MSVSLDVAVAAQIDSGAIKVIPLVKIDLPGKTVGYHTGGRPFTYSGQVYLPNRYLVPEGFSGALGNQISEITLIFSDVPTSDPDDAIAAIETYNYLNAPVTISFLAGDPVTDEVLGVLVTQFYEINDVEFKSGATDADGATTLTVEISIETLSRRLRDQTHVKRATEDQKRHYSATDTAFEYAATSPEWMEEWGQR